MSSLKIRRSFIVAFGVILLSIFIYKKFANSSTKPKVISTFQMVNVLTNTAENQNIPIRISLSGKLVAKNRIDLYAEVSGVLLSTDFREGNTYSRGQVIARIDARELQASLKSQKSALMNNISEVLPDLAIDFPNELATWKSFHKNISFTENLQALPEVQNDQLKLFLSSRGIFTAYYNVRSQEERLSKFVIRSPFSGVLSTADINPGALVRVGQKMGTFIEPGTYEMEASASIDDLRFFKLGDKVKLASDELTGNWTGNILRINKSMDASTQMVKIYIGVTGNDLREGQYMRANIQGVTLPDVVEVPRSILIEGNSLYMVKSDSILSKQKVDIAYQGVETAYIKNIPNGQVYLNQVLNTAYEGMIVKPIGSTKK